MTLLFSYLLTTLLAVPALCSLKIVSTPDGDLRPPPCALTCTGVSKHTDTDYFSWKKYKKQTFKYVTDISECGFVATPSITATLSGPTVGEDVTWCPAVYVWGNHETRGFYVFTVGESTISQMVGNRCDVHWTATGYHC